MRLVHAVCVPDVEKPHQDHLQLSSRQVNWFDALVLDCLWFCHDKHFVIPGTEDMTDAYHDYWLHIKGALIGMLLGIPAALVAGGIVALL